MILTSLPNVKSWLGLTTTTDDKMLLRMINDASRMIMNYLQRAELGHTTVIETVSGRGERRLQMRNWPVLEVNALSINGVTIPASSVSTSYGYYLEQVYGGLAGRPQNLAIIGGIGLGGGVASYGAGLVGFSPYAGYGGSQGPFVRGYGNISVNYTYGYAALNEPQVIPSFFLLDQAGKVILDQNGYPLVDQSAVVLAPPQPILDQNGNPILDQSGAQQMGQPLLDQSGNPILDQSGNPLMDQSGIVYIGGEPLMDQGIIDITPTVTPLSAFGSWSGDVGVYYQNSNVPEDIEDQSGDALQDQDGDVLLDQGINIGGGALVAVKANPQKGQYVPPCVTGDTPRLYYEFSQADAGIPVFINYNYVPYDVEQACIELVAERYRYKSRIGQVSQSLGGQETSSYTIVAMTDPIKERLAPYRLEWTG